jgi:amidophosphoribosyltransferase
MRSACPPIMHGCKYLNFTRSNSETELIARQAMHFLEGVHSEEHMEEYCDCTSRRYANMVEYIRKSLKMTTLAYHSLEGLLGCVGVDRRKLCTYCWNGKE